MNNNKSENRLLELLVPLVVVSTSSGVLAGECVVIDGADHIHHVDITQSIVSLPSHSVVPLDSSAIFRIGQI